MRRLVAGLDEAGRSCVVEDREVTFGEASASGGLDTLFETLEAPPPARPPGHGELLPVDVGPGCTRWIVVEFAPGLEFPTHHTDTLDFDIVLTGSVELTLDDGVHVLQAGDCVVMTGVDHAWRAGPDGCQLSVMFLGTPPPA